MPTRIKAAPTTRAAILAVMIAVSPVATSDAPSAATAIDRSEARALVALVPEVRETMAAGQKVNFFDIDIYPFNRSTYFAFFVSVPNEISSGIVGRYAVNKLTADLWDLGLGAWVCSPEIDARQKAIRQKHHISAEVIKQFGDVPMLPSDKSAGNQVCREDRPEAK
jgi:hypothetical protein